MAQYPPRSSVSRASFITTISNLPEPIGLLPKSSSDIQKSNPECSSSALLFAAALGWSLFLLTLALALILLALLVYQRIRVRLNKGALQTRTNRGIYTAHNANGAQAIVHVSRKGSTRRSGRRNGTLTNVATRSEGNTPELQRATITPDNKIPLNPFKLELNLDPDRESRLERSLEVPDGLNNSPAFNKCTFVIRDQPSPFASSAGPLKISRSADSNEDEYKWDRRKPPEGQQRKKAPLDDYCDVPEDDYKVPKLDLPARVPRGAAGRPLPKFSYGEVNPGSITTCAPKMSTSNENEDMDYVNSSTLKIQMPKNNHKPLPSLPQEQPAGAASGVGYSRATTSNEPLCARAGTSQTPSQFGRKDSEGAQESAAALPQVPPKPARTNKELESDYENSLGSSGKKKPAGERKNQKS